MPTRPKALAGHLATVWTKRKLNSWLASQMLSLSEILTRRCQKFELSNGKVATQGLVPTKAVAEN